MHPCASLRSYVVRREELETWNASKKPVVEELIFAR